MSNPGPDYLPPPPEHIRRIHRQVSLIRRLSDRVVGVGPFGIGLDGVLAWIPGAGLIYGVGAGVLLMVNGFRADASRATLTRMAIYLILDNLTDTVPVVGWAVDTLFPGHLMAANALQKDMEARHGPLEPGKLRRVGPMSAAERRRKWLWWIVGLAIAAAMIAVLALLSSALWHGAQAAWHAIMR